MESIVLFLKENKRKILVGAVAYILYVFSQLETYELGGLLLHIALNALVFIFVGQAVVTFAEKVVVDRRKKAV